MARYDVYANPTGPGYLLDVQADLLSGLNTRLVAPLLPLHDAPKPARRLNPVFVVRGEETVMVTQFMAAVPVSELRDLVASLRAKHAEILDAIDFLLCGC